MKYREIIRHILEDAETPEVVTTDGVTLDTNKLKESTKSKKLTLEEIKNMHEADPCVKVFKVEDHGDTYTIWGRII